MISGVESKLLPEKSRRVGDRYLGAKILLVMLASSMPAEFVQLGTHEGLVGALCLTSAGCRWVFEKLADALLFQVSLLAFSVLLIGLDDRLMSRERPPHFLLYASAFAIINAILVVIVTFLIFDVAKIAPGKTFVGLLADSQALPYTLLYILVSISIAPTVEEIVFRGIFWEALRNRHSEAVAFLGSSLAWCVIHFDNGPLKALYVVPYAILLGLMRKKSKGVVPCIILHAIINIEGTVLPNIVLLSNN